MSVLLRLVGLFFTVGLVLALVDVSSLVSLVAQVGKRELLLAALCAFLMQLFIALRWRVLNSHVGNALSIWRFFVLTMASSACNLISPGFVGFDIARAALLVKASGTDGASRAFSVVADRGVGLISCLLIGFGGAIVVRHMTDAHVYLLLTAGLLVIVLSVFSFLTSRRACDRTSRLLLGTGGAPRKLVGIIQTGQEALRYYRLHPKKTLSAIALAMLAHFSWLTLVFVLARNLGIDLPFALIAAVTTIVWVFVMLPVSFLGLGVSELSFIYLLSLQGVPAETAAALSLQVFAANLGLSLVSIPFLWVLPRRIPL